MIKAIDPTEQEVFSLISETDESSSEIICLVKEKTEIDLEVSSGDQDTTIARVYRKETDYESPDEFSLELFKNLLGHNGFCLHDNYYGRFRQTNYYALEGDELLCLADSFGFEPDDHMVDIDGDGDNELICNLTYGGDGARRTVLYHYDGERVLKGNLEFTGSERNRIPGSVRNLHQMKNLI